MSREALAAGRLAATRLRLTISKSFLNARPFSQDSSEASPQTNWMTESTAITISFIRAPALPSELFEPESSSSDGKAGARMSLATGMAKLDSFATTLGTEEVYFSEPLLAECQAKLIQRTARGR